MAVKWTEKQAQVIESRNRNLLVSAAAGSGKTAVLVERIIRMISEGEKPADIDKLLIMTFTNAAASEMRERIGAAIDKKLQENPDDEHLWLQAALIPQAQITTIDSFCLNVIRSHYNSLDIDPGFRIGDEGELSLLQGDVMGDMLEACYQEGDASFGRFVEQFGRGRSDAGIEEVILKAWQFSQSHPWPEEWLKECREELLEVDISQMEKSPWMEFLLNDIKLQMEELSGQLSDAIEVCCEENGPAAYEPMLLNDRAMTEKIKNAAESGHFKELYSALAAVSFERLASIRSKDIDGEKKAYVNACRDRVKKTVGKCQELYAFQSPEEAVESIRDTKEATEVLLGLCARFDEAYRNAKRERNILDFNDLEHLALQVLYKETEGGRKPSAAADELSRQYEEILVDEYQDSNYVQEALIEGISRERFGHPNVFMVGDVKQSIYRFRLAKPELFMEKYETYPKKDGPYEMIELQQNFRSRDSVLSSVNDLFFQIMTKNLGGIRYTEETALYPGAVFAPAPEGTEAGTPTELLLADTGAQNLGALDEDALDYTSKELEARMIAGEIRRMVSGTEKFVVWDKELGEDKSGGYRPVGYGDIVILLRSMSGWSEAFVNVLMNEGIPALAQTRTGYFNTVEVETVLSLLAVIDNPMQDIPLAAVMRSPIIGMTDEEMAWMMAAYKGKTEKNQDRGVYGAWKLWEEEHSGANGSGSGVTIGAAHIPGETACNIWKKLEKLEELLRDLRVRSRELPIHELLYQVYRKSGYYDYVSAMPAGETRRANLDMLVEKAAAYEATSYKGLFHFVRYIEKLKKFDTDFGEALPSGEKNEAVRIMSIHKSKGLEFPVVFLAGLGKRFNRQDAYGQLLLDADLGVAADSMDLELRVKGPTLKKQALKRKAELETLGEELRVLYVAMTRAKEKLILTATDRSLESKLEKWKESMAVDGQIPYTILSGATSCLDWILMAKSKIPAPHMQVKQIAVSDLVGREVARQIDRQEAKEALLGLDGTKNYDETMRRQLEEHVHYQYPFQDDAGLYAMMAVSELKKQSQADLMETSGSAAADYTLAGSREEAARQAGPNRGALRGTAYHRALECLKFQELHSKEDTKEALKALCDQGFLEQEAYGLIRADVIWKFLESPLGRRMAKAQEDGRLLKEQQFMMGVPAKDMGKGSSEELVLIQGIIDACMEEEDGLVLIDYKTDRVPTYEPEQSGELLRQRYKVQLDYYERALRQLTGKNVKQRVIYSLTLQREIEV